MPKSKGRAIKTAPENLHFEVKSLKCPHCGADYSNEQYVMELFLEMEDQSRIQKEPQLNSYTDIFDKGTICAKCGKTFIWRIKFIKIRNYVMVEQLEESEEREELNQGF